MRPVQNNKNVAHDDLSLAAAERLVAYEEAKAAGNGAALNKPTEVPLREQLADDLACVDLLHRVWPDLAPPEAVPDEAPSPKTLGDFRIIRELGRGGMGTVFEAEQLSMGRRVALKVLPFASLVQDNSLQRFRNEVRAAAALDHPHIVAVYSIGEERGVHFFAMQLIRGQTLADLIRERRRSRRALVPSPLPKGEDLQHARPPDEGRDEDSYHDTPTIDIGIDQPPSTQRVEQARISTAAGSRQTTEQFRLAARLGSQAAEALQHAHDLGVLHRDIKPGNLLLDADGKLFVSDFGLARIEADVGITRTGDIVGTLRYMAPEQALAKRVVIDHRADVYSLGATLYELLTLQPPFGETDRSELLKQIAFEEPCPLRKLDRRIPVELETIVFKSMAKNPDERYQTAQQLSDDLQAFLENRPIKARPLTTWDRANKWSRRHPAALWSAVAMLLFLLMASTVATMIVTNERNRAKQQAAIAETQRRLAESRTALARRVVNDMVMKVWLKEDPDIPVLKRQFLETSLDFYKELDQEGTLTEIVDLQDFAQSYVAMGAIQEHLGRPELAQQQFQRGVETYRQCVDSTSSAKLLQRFLGAQDNAALNLMQNERLSDAKILLDEAIAWHLARSPRFEEHEAYRATIAKTFELRGICQKEQGQLDAAKADYDCAIEHLRQIVANPNADEESWTKLASALQNRAVIHKARSEFDEAHKLITEAIVISKELVRLNPRRTHFQLVLCKNYHFLAILAQESHRPEVGVEAAKNELALARRLIEDHPASYTHHCQLASCLNTLANIEKHLPGADGAEDHYQESIDVCRRLEQEFPDGALHPEHLATALVNLANMLRGSADNDRAQKLLQEAVSRLEYICDKSEKPNDQLVLSIALGNYAATLDSESREALDVARRVVELRRALFVSHSTNVDFQVQLAGALHQLSVKLFRQDSFVEALKCVEEALELQEQAVQEQPNHPQARTFLRNHYCNLAWYLNDCPDESRRDPQRAIEMAKKALELDAEFDFGKQHLAVGLYRTGHLMEAKYILLSIVDSDKTEATRCFALSATFSMLNDTFNARKWFDEGTSRLVHTTPPDRFDVHWQKEAESQMEKYFGAAPDGT